MGRCGWSDPRQQKHRSTICLHVRVLGVIELLERPVQGNGAEDLSFILFVELLGAIDERVGQFGFSNHLKQIIPVTGCGDGDGE